MSRTAARVAASKTAHPEEFCPNARCLWRTGGGACPRHAASSLRLVVYVNDGPPVTWRPSAVRAAFPELTHTDWETLQAGGVVSFVQACEPFAKTRIYGERVSR